MGNFPIQLPLIANLLKNPRVHGTSGAIQLFGCILSLIFGLANARTTQAIVASETPATEQLEVASHRPGLKLRLIHQQASHVAHREPVLFIHGSSFPSDLSFGFRMKGISWMDFMSAHGYDVYAMDFLGYGRSDRYPEMLAPGLTPLGRAHEVETDIDHAVELIRTRTGQSRVTLIGHSWGGSVAARYAQHHPDKVAHLVLYAAITPNRLAPQKPPMQIARAVNDLVPAERLRQMDNLRPAGQASPALAAEVLNTWAERWLASDPLATAHQAKTVRFPAGPDQDVADMQAGLSYYQAEEIRVPTLLVRGAWDAYPSDADYRWLFDRLAHAPFKQYLVIPEGTHVMHLENSREHLYDAVLSFLQSASGMQATKQRGSAQR